MTYSGGNRSRILVTGCSGFIATALMPQLRGLGAVYGLDREPRIPAEFPVSMADVRRLDELQRLADDIRPDVVVHLAASSSAVTPWSALGDLLASNIEGVYNVLEAFRPRLFVFASSSSVYGNARLEQAQPAWDNIAPVGHYGLSKATGERICRDWARSSGAVAICFRFGNVIGPGCRGLLRYLIDHVRENPKGRKPAQFRGGGRLVRDYIPVAFVVDAVIRALRAKWPDGSSHLFNASSGIGMTNREVVEAAAAAAAERGFRLTSDWSEEPSSEEADHVTLDPRALEDRLEWQPPRRDQILASVRETVFAGLSSTAAPSTVSKAPAA